MSEKKRIPKVRIARPKGRNFELRYTDAETKKEVRISTGTIDQREVAEQKRLLEAKLLVGVDAKPKKRSIGGPRMPWEEFREQYRAIKLLGSNRKPSGIEAAEYRLDVIERILRPRTLGDVANGSALETLQVRLLAGEGATPKKKKAGDENTPVPLIPRSPHTVKSYMRAVIAALNWARKKKQWLSTVPDIEIVRVSKLRHAKGRPLCGEEFERMIAAVEVQVGKEAKESWTYLLRGLVESGLRIEELMSMHWTDHKYIVPLLRTGNTPLLSIPADMQKNYTEEAIPMLPGFVALLRETPDVQRTGFCFKPVSLQVKLKRKNRAERLSAKWVGKIISRIGKAAGVKVNERTGKCASAHDLRRTTAQDMCDAEVSENDATSIMRHSSFETTRRYYATGNVQRAAARLQVKMSSVPRYGLPATNLASEQTTDSNSTPLRT